MNDEKEAEVYEMLLAVTHSLVDRPDDVKITMAPDQESIVFTIEAHPSDLGKLTNAGSSATLALDADTGKIKWELQSTPA